MKKVLSFVMAMLMVFSIASFASCTSNTPEATEAGTGSRKYVIGLSGPMTGDAAQYGIGVRRAAEMAVEEINAKGGLFGIDFSLVSVDDQADPSKVGTAYATLLSKGVQFSLGCVTSGAGAEFTTLSKEDNLFFITPSASNDEIPVNSNGYQMCFADGNQGAAAAAFVNETLAGKTIGVIYCSGDNYSTGIYEQFSEKLDDSITVKVASFTDKATDFSSQVDIVKDCEFVFLPIYYTPASQIMIEAKKHENSIKVFYGCDGLDGISTIPGFDINSIPQEISYLSHFNSAAESGPSKDFVEAYKAKYDGEVPSQFAAGAYDCVYAIYKALLAAGQDKVNPEMSASELCDVLTAQFDGDFTFYGVTGSNMKWNRNTTGYGYVEKTATKYIVKNAD